MATKAPAMMPLRFVPPPSRPGVRSGRLPRRHPPPLQIPVQPTLRRRGGPPHLPPPHPQVLASIHFDCSVLLGPQWIPTSSPSSSSSSPPSSSDAPPSPSPPTPTGTARCRAMLTNFGLITILYSNCARTERQSNVKGILRFLSLILVSDVLRFVFFVHFSLCVIYRLGMAISAYHDLVESHAAAVTAEDPGDAGRAAGD
ncbi:hypothetical protein COCNU_07G000450 [Cocos nucifera]|uniref:Uncharacterized protein n=1 Tax=Cocos nucifera TaxID=13894 RepID=A0A8K0IDM7_COCNU|nr:hypothetical protein COCNU_07G000450 [Cocos nucifera]